jgi:hypothetical protein
MEKPFTFILGSHYHIPLGADDEEFERLYARKLKPFLSALNQFPQIEAVLHYSGVLLHWLERAHPAFFMLIDDLISRKQIELLGGGFYEPMTPLLPLPDKIGQIELLTTYLRKQFSKKPQGCWLPALAWEQDLAGALNNCGMLYTFLDEKQFSLAEIPAEKPCITEYQGKILTIFPISTGLSASFAEKKASFVIEDLLSCKNRENREKNLFCVFLDSVFMENETSEEDRYHIFFEELARFEEKIDFTTPRKIYNEGWSRIKTYFPASMRVDGQSEPRLETPRRFLIDYPEANYLYAKMIFTNALINQLHGDKSRKRTAREEIWKAQVYDAFCPVKGGGIYLQSVRKSAYRALLEAEKISRESRRFTPSLTVFDFDLDGREEFLFQEEQINCYIKPSSADVFELDYLPKVWNYLDTFSPPDGKEGKKVKRSAWTDIFAPDSFQNFAEAEAEREKIRFCKNEIFEVIDIDKTHQKVCFRLPANESAPYGRIVMQKTYQLRKNTLSIHYLLVNTGEYTERFAFIPSVDLSFAGEGDAFLRIFKLNADIKESMDGGAEQVSGVKLQDMKNEVIISIVADKLFDVAISPVRTFSEDGRGAYQSTNILPIKRISLEPEERFEIEFTMSMYH